MDEALLLAQFAHDLLALAAAGAAASAVAGAKDFTSGTEPGAAGWLAELRRLAPELRLPWLVAAAQAAGRLPPELEMDDVRRLFALFRAARQAFDRYRPAAYPGRLILLLAASRADRGRRGGRTDPAGYWAALAGAGAEIELLAGDHYAIVSPPAVALLAQALGARLAARRRAWR
jgi:thioesterase domain-containing protein